MIIEKTSGNTNKKISVFITALTLIVCVLAISVFTVKHVYGADTAVLKVINGSKTVEFYLSGDGKTEDIHLYTKDSKGNKKVVENYKNGQRLKYSTINDYGTPSETDVGGQKMPYCTNSAYGPEIKSILAAAGINIAKLSTCSITFAAVDGFKRTLNWNEITANRYYCPNRASNEGAAVADDPEKVAVPVIIDLDNYYTSTGRIKNGGTLRIGQSAPNNHNDPLSVKHMAETKKISEEKVNTGTITINKKQTDAWKNDVEPKDGFIVDPGEELDFTYKNQTDATLGIGYGLIHYTLDGSVPSELSAIYNWNPYGGEMTFDGPKAPNEYGDFIVKTKIMGPGRADSVVRTYYYSVANADICEKQDVTKLSCSMYVYNGKAKTPVVTIDGLEKDTDYKVSYSENVKCGIAKVKVQGIVPAYGRFFTKAFTIKPAAGKVTGLKCLKKKKLRVTVKNQKASGITGYEISYKKSGTKSWKKVNLIASKSSCTISKLKKGKKYCVRVRAYKTADGKKIFGAYSRSKVSKKIK